ncbi:Protein HRI1 [Fusarium keratoplasticum]|nr:Protein HRI1 [Fusarium keratoplasticum]
MTLRLSTRISIRWADDAPSEPTDTVVLSVGDYFMDLRITKADQSIDWAFAGTREILSRDPLHCRWNHTIDSRLSFDPDEGKFQPLPNGDDLETGSMPCAEKGNQVTPYEEVWRELQPRHGMNRGWILQGKLGSDDVFLGHYGGIYLAMRQNKQGVFSVLKEELTNVQGRLRWKRAYLSGDLKLPSLSSRGVISPPEEEKWRVGGTAVFDGQVYQVRALEIHGQEKTIKARTSRL